MHVRGFMKALTLFRRIISKTQKIAMYIPFLEVLVKFQAACVYTWKQKYFKGVPKTYPFIGGREICEVVEK